jgi:spore coat protein CotH
MSFDKFEDTYAETKDQRFYGFKSLGLSNGSSDPSLVRDKLGTDIFAAAGIPAPATAFYRIFIDHGDGPTYFGLYTGIEIPSDDAFLDTQFDSHKGNLYKPDGSGAQWASLDTATLGKENHEDAADFSDAQALFDALHGDRTDAVAWRAGLEAHLDVDGFLHWLALNTVIQDWDTYGRMAHNYYLYADPGKGGQFRWIPWDHSFAFKAGMGALSLGMTEVTDQWPLIRYLLDDPEYLKIYKQYVAQAAATDYEPAAAEKRFQAAHDLIKPYVVGAEGEIQGYTFLSTATAFDGSLAELIAHAKQRQTDVATFLMP